MQKYHSHNAPRHQPQRHQQRQPQQPQRQPRRHELRIAFVAALPVVLGYVVLGIPCGILGAQAGLDIAQVALMSVFFYSGAGQYMIANLWMAGVPLPSIIASVTLVNSRQLLYAASLSRFFSQASKRALVFFGATVTDESFGVNLARFEQGAWSTGQALAANVFPWISWTVSNVVGAVVGSLLTVPAALAAFAMTSIFLCLLFMQKLSLRAVVAAVTAALGVLAMKLMGFSDPAIFVGAVLGVVAALLVPGKADSNAGGTESGGALGISGVSGKAAADIDASRGAVSGTGTGTGTGADANAGKQHDATEEGESS